MCSVPLVESPGTVTLLITVSCWSDRLIGPWADPAGSHYNYYALIPSENLWNGKDLPKNWSANQNISCVMTNTAGQLPGDG